MEGMETRLKLLFAHIQSLFLGIKMQTELKRIWSFGASVQVSEFDLSFSTIILGWGRSHHTRHFEEAQIWREKRIMCIIVIQFQSGDKFKET